MQNEHFYSTFIKTKTEVSALYENIYAYYSPAIITVTFGSALKIKRQVPKVGRVKF